MITLDALTLPEDLIWLNEFNWTPVQQSTRYTLTGALIIDSGVKQAGQPIILAGDSEAAWITRADLKTLNSMRANDAQMTLTLNDGQVFNVRFDHKNQPIQAQQIVDYNLPVDQDFYSITLRFITV